MIECCGNCSHYQAPPDTWKGRPDIGACLDVLKDYVHEGAHCRDWQAIEEEA